jgi:hypothetical protein
MAVEKKVVEVKTVPSDVDIYGYLGGAVTFTPTAFKKMKVPKKKQFSVDIEPMSADDCTAINSLNKSEQMRMSLWYSSPQGKLFTEANEKLRDFKGDDNSFTDEDFNNVQSIVKQRALINTDAQKYKIVQNSISNLTAPHPLADGGVICDTAWDNMPQEIKAEIYNKCYDISYLGVDEAINLQ